MRAIVVFRDECDRWYAPFLKRGFRHVFCAVEDGDYWIQVDGRMGVPAVQMAAAGDFDLAGWYREQGLTVVETVRGNLPPRGPFIAANCVGMIKTALGIRAPFAFTPHQLYRTLKRREHGLSEGDLTAGAVAAVPGRR